MVLGRYIALNQLLFSIKESSNLRRVWVELLVGYSDKIFPSSRATVRAVLSSLVWAEILIILDGLDHPFIFQDMTDASTGLLLYYI